MKLLHVNCGFVHANIFVRVDKCHRGKFYNGCIYVNKMKGTILKKSTIILPHHYVTRGSREIARPASFSESAGLFILFRAFSSCQIFARWTTPPCIDTCNVSCMVGCCESTLADGGEIIIRSSYSVHHGFLWLSLAFRSFSHFLAPGLCHFLVGVIPFTIWNFPFFASNFWP